MKKLVSILSGVAFVTFANAAAITVDPAATKQQIVGFGAGAVYYQDWVNALGKETREAFYDTAFTGLNLSLLRMGNWLQDPAKDISADVAIVKAAKQRLGSQLKIEMSSWSAPSNLKPSNSVNGKDAFGDSLKATLNVANDAYGKYAYSEFAAWWKKSYEAYLAAGIAPDYISFQNEPDMFAEYEETLFAPTETSKRAGYAEALKAVKASLGTLANPPKIFGPEPLGIGYNNFQNYMKAIDENLLDGFAYHLYHAGNGNDNSEMNYYNPENFRSPMKTIASKYGSDAKPLIMTEFCSMAENGKEEYMTGLAHIMQVGLTDGKLNGYIAWELFWGEGNGQLIGVCAKGWGNCTEDKIVINPEYHAMRHYSKFVSPGWRVINSVSEGENIFAVAFRSADCDSITVVAVNEGAAQNLNAPVVQGYEAIYAVQSIEGGEKSKEISTSVSYMLPANSITTFVYKALSIAGLTCEDAPVVDPFKPAVNDTIVLLDYSAGIVGNWSGDFTITEGKTPIDGISAYAKVPLAGCAQGNEGCDYQHAQYALPAAASDALSSCSELIITMHSQDDTTTYVNVGGIGTEWVNYQYGVQAGSNSWTEESVELTNEESNGSSKLSFNSDGSGVYISKIIAIGCGTAAISEKINSSFVKNGDVKIFDLNGNLIFAGKKSKAINDRNELQIKVPQGMYLVKSNGNSFKAIKK